MIELLPGDIEGYLLRISPSFVSNGHWCVRKSALKNVVDFVDVEAYRKKVPLLGPVFAEGGESFDPFEIGCSWPQDAQDITDEKMEEVFCKMEGFGDPRIPLDDLEIDADEWRALASEDGATWCFVKSSYLILFEGLFDVDDGIFAPIAARSENFVEPFENATLIFDTDESKPWNVMILGGRVHKPTFHASVLKAAKRVERYREATK